MRPIHQVMAALLLGSAVAAAAEDAGVDPRLVEADAAYQEADELMGAGKWHEALPKAERALALREAVLGASDLKVADSLIMTGWIVYGAEGDCARAEPMLQRALSIREAILGKNHPAVARSLHRLCGLYTEQELFDKAELMCQRALAIKESVLGKSALEVARTLNMLGVISHNEGRYPRAEAFYQRTLAIYEAAPGRAHLNVETPLVNLAEIYSEQGMYDRAEPLLQRALTLLEEAVGKSDPGIAGVIEGLGELYLKQGLYDRAEPLLERAIAMDEAAYGKSSPVVANVLYKLGSLYESQGRYDRAEPLLERALAIQEATRGKSHLEVSRTLIVLGELQREQGAYDRAEPLLERALASLETAFGESHLDTAHALIGLADLHRDQGLYDRAEPLYERALAALETELGKSNPNLVRPLQGLAQLRLRQRRKAEALPLLARALSISEGRLRHEALDFSEARLASFLQFLGRDGDRLYSLARAYPDDEGARRLALTSALLLKGRSVEEAADTSRVILRSMGAGDREAFEHLRGLRTRLAQLSLDGPGKLAPAEYQQRLQRLEDDGDALEADLAKRSAPLRALTTLPSTADILQRATAALPRDGALVELVAYTDSPPVPRPGTPESRLPAQPRYLALALFPDGRTGTVDLGPADVLDKAALRLRAALASRDAHVQTAARELYRLAFKPLLPLLGNVRKVLLAPDGQLALVPFSAFHDGRRFLADAFDFTYLTSGRDLLPPPGDLPASASTSTVIFADPDYSAAPPAQASAPDGGVTLTQAERSYSVERFFSLERDNLSGPRWAPLPGTRLEAEAIHRLFPEAQAFLGADASKERLLHLPAPGILHIATHGFFLADAAASPGARALGAQDLSAGGATSRPPDPLLRSGLVLAGAGSRADIGSSLVTALELAGLDLWGTQLVVLSACDTGRGDVKRGQGVYGLRRAFIVAGAETLVVSLWKVDDETTHALMERYYRNLLAGQGRGAALREAMLSLRAQHFHPYYWAPFIALGSAAPLRGFASPTTHP